jgi:hypothetical protein
METRRAYFRNMRSKCRCSCVLQFTRHLGVSSVLHRPLSQMIHCIVLYLDFQSVMSECASQQQAGSANKCKAATTHQGEITNSGRRQKSSQSRRDRHQPTKASQPTHYVTSPTHKLDCKNCPTALTVKRCRQAPRGVYSQISSHSSEAQQERNRL